MSFLLCCLTVLAFTVDSDDGDDDGGGGGNNDDDNDEDEEDENARHVRPRDFYLYENIHFIFILKYI